LVDLGKGHERDRTDLRPKAKSKIEDEDEFEDD